MGLSQCLMLGRRSRESQTQPPPQQQQQQRQQDQPPTCSSSQFLKPPADPHQNQQQQQQQRTDQRKSLERKSTRRHNSSSSSAHSKWAFYKLPAELSPEAIREIKILEGMVITGFLTFEKYQETATGILETELGGRFDAVTIKVVSDASDGKID